MAERKFTKKENIENARAICVAFFEKVMNESPSGEIMNALLDIKSTNDKKLLREHFTIVRGIMDDALKALGKEEK